MLELPKSRRAARIFLSAGLIIATAVYAVRQDMIRPKTAVPSRKVQIAARPAPPLPANVAKQNIPQPFASPIPAQPPVDTGAAPPRAAMTATAPPPKSSSGAATAPAPPSRFIEGAYEGDVIETRYGPVQVTIRIVNDHIASVECPQFPNDRLRSQEISNSAIPTLIEETIQAQSADINVVSGATETSAGFYESLTSSLEKAKIKTPPPAN